MPGPKFVMWVNSEDRGPGPWRGTGTDCTIVLKHSVEENHDQVALAASSTAEYTDVMRERDHWQAHWHSDQWMLTSEQVADNEALLSQLRSEEFMDRIPSVSTIRVNPEHVGQVLWESSGSVE
jgi:hypothetical protein